MATGIAFIILFGLLADWLMRKFRLPGLIGLLVIGVIVGPYCLNVFSPEMKNVASDLRLIALVIILLRAGLEVSKSTLAKVGARALLMSFIPCLCEVGVITYFGPKLLDLTTLESAILGSILAAVSPAVVVPFMIQFINEGRGKKHGAPTLILAAASCDDAFAIVLCTSFLGMYTGNKLSTVQQVVSLPISIILGIAGGALIGLIMCKLFDKFNPRATKKVLILMSASIFLVALQENIHSIINFSALLATMTIGFVILEKREPIAHELSSKLAKIWIFAQLVLFILVGSEVNVPVALDAGVSGIIIIFLGLLGRSIGVQLCLMKSIFTIKERAFITISYLPKATVQAAMGAVPLLAMKAAGMITMPGEIILAVAVLSILITAPLGAVAISATSKKLLEQ
ncbi:MAG: cation:proton antiporter [Kiritimatiellae bacterium]|jgi:NhaP-type Na+/H+ or K+/H+ antiporter|nr:cation:proton antiporter [Kiritimatiellia bacterium]